VRAGRVIFSGWFNGYGNMVIIDHGESYSTVYAHAHELFKKLGDMVDTHEVIATVGETGSMAGPKLYFEMRYRGKPVDPLKWMKQG
jgi:septal ring factor EnvC (AmiA/AmiB activator)